MDYGVILADRAVAVLLGAFLMLGSEPALPAEVNRAQLLEVVHSLVRVEARKAQGGFAFGSGVVVAPERVVTNCHVTRDAQAVYLVNGGSRWRAQAQLSDLERDLCLLWAPGLEAAPAAVAGSADLYVGQAVTAVGFGGGGIQPVAGDIAGLYRHRDAMVIRSSAAFASGASGGGLFDEQGRLIGILTFRLPSKGAYYFSVPVDWIRGRILDLDHYSQIAPLGDERPFWELSRTEQPYFMRASALEAAQDWAALLRLTETWRVVEPDNPDSLRFHGTAMERLQ